MTEKETIQNIAIKIAEEQLKNSSINGPIERTIFILGSNGVVSSTYNLTKLKKFTYILLLGQINDDK